MSGLNCSVLGGTRALSHEQRPSVTARVGPGVMSIPAGIQCWHTRIVKLQIFLHNSALNVLLRLRQALP